MNFKRNIILKEIEEWKEKKILSAESCDYLTRLYTEGSENSTRQLGTKKRSHLFIMLMFLLSTSSIAFLVYYFSDFSNQMQISLIFFYTFIYGAIARIFYLQFIGLFSLILTLAWSTFPADSDHFSWLNLESAWFVAFVISLFVSWMIQKMNTKLSLNLYVNGLVLLFVPSIQAFNMSKAPLDELQLLIFAKVIIMSALLYMNRERVIDMSKFSS